MLRLILLKIFNTTISLIFLEFSNPAARSSRSAGGHHAPIKNHPYTVSIRYAGAHMCGGSILSKNVILTAAHCIPEDLSLDLFDVKAGSADIKYKGTWHPVVKVVVHEEFQIQHLLEDNESRATLNDVALLKLGKSIDIDNETTRRIELFNENDDVHNYPSGILSGWGMVPAIVNKTEPNFRGNGTIIRKKGIARPPTNLTFVELNIAPQEKCFNSYPSANLMGQFCTYTTGKKSCFGDSGSPFEVNGKQAGITSWGFGMCNEGANTAFFTEVAKFYKWIVGKMRTL